LITASFIRSKAPGDLGHAYARRLADRDRRSGEAETPGPMSENGTKGGGVWEALLRPAGGEDKDATGGGCTVPDGTVWKHGARRRVCFGSVEEWMEDARGRGFAVGPAVALEGHVINQDGGTVLRVTDPAAVPGHDVFYVLLWTD